MWNAGSEPTRMIEVISPVTEVFGLSIAPCRYRFATGGAAAHHDCVLFHREPARRGQR